MVVQSLATFPTSVVLPRESNASELGQDYYWTATLVAGLIIVSVAWSYVYNVEQGAHHPDCPFAICRSYLAGGVGLPLFVF